VDGRAVRHLTLRLSAIVSVLILAAWPEAHAAETLTPPWDKADSSATWSSDGTEFTTATAAATATVDGRATLSGSASSTFPVPVSALVGSASADATALFLLPPIPAPTGLVRGVARVRATVTASAQSALMTAQAGVYSQLQCSGCNASDQGFQVTVATGPGPERRDASTDNEMLLVTFQIGDTFFGCPPPASYDVGIRIAGYATAPASSNATFSGTFVLESVSYESLPCEPEA
jgi:hypothetical protein